LSTMGKEKKEKKEKKREREEDPDKAARKAAKKAAKAAAQSAAADEKRDGSAADVAPGVTFETFDAAPFSQAVQALLTAKGFTAPSKIQQHAWPVACAGKDAIAVAKTGSGKTLAFLLPILHRMEAAAAASDGFTASSSIPEPDALILAPTRELALQIHAEADKFGAATRASAVAVYGGAPMHKQKEELTAAHAGKKRGATTGTVVVATPGRLCDLMKQGSLSLKRCAFITLDEADRMLEMGFEPQLKEIFGELPSSADGRQTLLFTATWPKAVRKMAAAYLAKGESTSEGGTSGKDDDGEATGAVKIFIGDGADGAELAANKAVSQKFVHATDDEKDKKMYDILCELPEGSRVVAFANTKRRVENLAKTFWGFGFGTVSVHGDKRQNEREAALKKFVDNQCPLMFATDVAARGLDIKGVTHVVNFDMARDVESYVHRIGRTGRAGELGASVTFWNPDYDKECAPALCKIARDAGQEVPEWLAKFEKSKESKQWKVANAKLTSAEA
jgi:superfamily II DNA/RNA helicase